MVMNPVLRLAACTIDFTHTQVKRGNELLPLTATEQRLLSKLAGNLGKIVTIDALCEAGWGDASYGTESSLMTHIQTHRGED
jgi:DNA-binding response OmpR family regulator